MCKFEREGKMPIIFDDDSQMFFNTGFIDELASLLRVGGYVPDRYKNVIIPMMIITRLDYEVTFVDENGEIKEGYVSKRSVKLVEPVIVKEEAEEIEKQEITEE